MAVSVVRVVILLGVVFGDYGSCQSQEGTYEPHFPYVQPVVNTFTVTRTETRTHTVQQIVTSAVSDVDLTTQNVVVTSLATQYSFTGIYGGQDTAVITVTTTPVVVESVTRVTHPVRTLVSVFSTFSTTTVTDDFVLSVTSEATQVSVLVSPIYQTSVLQQVVVTSTIQYSTVTTTVKSPKYGYRG